jgi:hypothetical protein
MAYLPTELISPVGSSLRKLILIPVAILLVCGALYAARDWYVAVPADAVSRATYVGRATCAECHESETRQWQGSHHDHAMEVATEQSVLGDFDDSSFTRMGVTTRFFRQGDQFFVNTEGPDGKYHDYEIAYTFGVDPLQQYMIQFDDGRVQVLRIAWDTKREQWFYVPPPDVLDERIEPGDPMHWTGISQNWNTTCAECHSTNLQKNYDLSQDQYHTTFSEINVSCETCHGPGSTHVELARNRTLFWDRNVGYGLPRLKGKDPTAEIETCATCHSRRSLVHANYRPGEPYLDNFEPSLLHEGLYHADGQILDEVYVYGSFLQSKMHAKGVRCTDCHNPHSLELKFTGNKLCGQCHQPGRYDTPSHHHHPVGSAGAQCIECHMAAQTFMVVDPRRDHSFQVPRPDLSVELGTPNACNNCHTKPAETPAWAAGQVRDWYGEKRADDPHWAHALAAARNGDPDAHTLLTEVIERQHSPAIVKATALDLLSGLANPGDQSLFRSGLHSPSDLVRAAAVRGIPISSADQIGKDLAPALRDPRSTVRFAAAMRLVDMPRAELNSQQRDQLDRVIKEYRDSQANHTERAASHLNLGNLDRRLSNNEAAEASFRTAIRLEPYLTGPRSELASLMESQGINPEEVGALRRDELELLKRDAKLLPDSAATFYRLGLMYFLLGDLDQAQDTLQTACELAPQSYDFLMALALLQERRQQWTAAIESLKKMQQLQPDDRRTRQIYKRLLETRQQQDQ